MNFIKNIFKALAAISIVATASTAFAGSVNENSGNFPTFMTTDRSLSNSSWSRSTSISAGELLSFRMHYYLQEGDSTSNMRFSMENLNNRTFSAGDSENVSGTVSASGLDSDSGSVTVNFADDVRLNLYNVSWQQVGCTSVGCETPLPNSANGVITSSGMSIGSVEGYTNGNWQGRHYAGDVVVSFRVTAEGGSTGGDDIEVSTNSATSVDEDSATLNGEVEEGDDVEVWFALSTFNGPSCSSSSQRIDVSGDRDEGDSFSETVTNLNDDTTYYYRSCGENNDGEDSGTIRSFTTDDEGGSNNNDDIEVSTDSASSVDEDSATLNGEVEEGDDVEVWFAFSRTDSTPSCSSSSQRIDVSGGDLDEGDDFSDRVTNLLDNTTYYYRACGENNDGDDEGFIRSFRTDDEDDNNDSDDIEVTTEDVEDVEETSARLTGELEEGDDAEVWFALASEFGSSPSCSNNSQRIDVNGDYDSGDDFFTRVSGLEEDTTYFYRACAEDDNGDSNGNIEEFETDGNSDNGQISTLTPTSVTTESARLNGRLDEGDDAEVWFALSRTDSTPSCSNSSQREDVSGRYDDGDTFSEVVTSLRDNSTYYYRACGEDEDGEEVFGSVRTFITGNGGNTVTQSAITGSATGVTTVFARLNGDATGSGNGECYFNYGTTTAVPLKTPDVSVSGSIACAAPLTNLSPNTTYFYQTVLERDGVVRKGVIRSFRTTSNLPPVVINNPPVANPNPGTTIIRVVDRVDQNEEDLGVTKWVSGEFDDDFVTAIDARRGEVVFYRVLVRNNTDEVLEDVEVTDRIPFELELANNNDIDDDSDKQLVWEINELDPGESKIFITEMRVREDTPIGLEIVSFASAEADEFESDSNNVLIEVVGGEIDEDDNNQGASIFGAGFFPDSLLGWLILIAILIVIAYLVSRLLFSRKESHKLNAELAAMEADRINRLR